MKTLQSLSLAAVLAGSLALGTGCGREVVSHTEKEEPKLLGGREKTETTVYKNPDGTTSTEKSTQKTP